MIEKVALAISGSDDPSNILTIHRIRARLAIEAMREPSEGMLKSVQHEAMLFNNDVDMERTYTKMIDAALKEE